MRSTAIWPAIHHSYHAPQVLIRVQSRKVFLVTAMERGLGQIHFGRKVVVKVLVVSHGVVLLGRVHYLTKTEQVLVILNPLNHHANRTYLMSHVNVAH